MNPDQLSLKELAYYGLLSDDPWVKRLAYYVEQFSFYVPKDCQDDPDYWFQNYEETLQNCERDVRYAEEEFEYQTRELHEKIEKQEREIGALRYDLDAQTKREFENCQIAGLKGQVMRLHDQIREMEERHEVDRKFHGSVVNEMGKLKKAYDELHEKYNVFSILAN